MAETMFQRIVVGDVIQVKESNDEHSLSVKPHFREWTVTHVYPYHIECRSGKTVTSFTYGEMVQLGYEVVPQYDTKDEPAHHWFME